MIKYKTIEVTIPDGEEVTETILSVPDGARYRVYGFIRESTADVMLVVTRNGIRDIEVPMDADYGYGDSIPYNAELEGPAEIKIGGRNSSGGSVSPNLTVVYEEL